MKKLIALMLGLVLILSMSNTAFAAGEQTGTTTITAEVPEAPTPLYTIHIPDDVTLTYLNGSPQTIGKVYVSDVTTDHNIYCKVTFTNLYNGSSYIPVSYQRKVDSDYFNIENGWTCGMYVIDEALGYGEERTEDLAATVTLDDWHAASPGTYTATMTFSFYY